MINQKLICATLISVLFTLHVFGKTKVIYGEDNRVDVYASSNSLFVELARSTSAMIPKNLFKNAGNDYSLKISKLSSRGICKSERFSNQNTAADCSGFLVAPNLMVTAGHCIKSQYDCEKYNWVFDYKVEDEQEARIPILKSNVFACKRIVDRTMSNTDDWSLIELDRDVPGRRPLTIRKSGRPEIGAKLVVIGHPSGLPTKIADGAWVLSHSSKYFSANLDTYGGNSGSAVFDATTGIVEGILVRGAADYVFDSEQKCRVSNRISNDAGNGEDVTYITNVKHL